VRNTEPFRAPHPCLLARAPSQRRHLRSTEGPVGAAQKNSHHEDVFSMWFEHPLASGGSWLPGRQDPHQGQGLPVVEPHGTAPSTDVSGSICCRRPRGLRGRSTLEELVMARLSDDERSERRDGIIAATTEHFSGQGFHATSMAEIIADSGVAAGTVYKYFASKTTWSSRRPSVLSTVSRALWLAFSTANPLPRWSLSWCRSGPRCRRTPPERSALTSSCTAGRRRAEILVWPPS
jgi:hypothetical protein